MSSHKVFPIDYKIFRKDRPSRGGDVGIAVKDSIPCSRLSCTNDAEMIWAKLCFSTLSIIVGAFYHPPNCDVPHLWAQHEFLCALSKRCTHVLLASDFNLPHIDWDHMQPPRECQQSHLLKSFVASHALQMQLKAFLIFHLRLCDKVQAAKLLKVFRTTLSLFALSRLLVSNWIPLLKRFHD